MGGALHLPREVQFSDIQENLFKSEVVFVYGSDKKFQMKRVKKVLTEKIRIIKLSSDKSMLNLNMLSTNNRF